MRIDLFDYDLPADRIAQEPAARREDARLMVLYASTGEIEHRGVSDLPSILSPGDLLVLNDTRVLPARLRARRASGGYVEVLLIEPVGERDGCNGDAEDGGGDGGARRWRALVRPARRIRAGETLTLLPRPRPGLAAGADGDDRRAPAELDGSGPVEIEVTAVEEGGRRIVELPDDPSPDRLLDDFGHTPLPPYIHRDPGDDREARDRDRYQTVYADVDGAIAAPTAGLHFTESLLERIRAAGVEIARITLHVGIGTFRPVAVDEVEEHVMEAERARLPEATVDAIERARGRGGHVVAVGTTVVRTLEDRAGGRDSLEPGTREATIFIHPGHRFRIVDAMVTNFHLPRSTPILLVAALAGRERVLSAYAEAIREDYRFYSYGDAMLVLP